MNVTSQSLESSCIIFADSLPQESVVKLHCKTFEPHLSNQIPKGKCTILAPTKRNNAIVSITISLSFNELR